MYYLLCTDDEKPRSVRLTVTCRPRKQTQASDLNTQILRPKSLSTQNCFFLKMYFQLTHKKLVPRVGFGFLSMKALKKTFCSIKMTHTTSTVEWN